MKSATHEFASGLHVALINGGTPQTLLLAANNVFTVDHGKWVSSSKPIKHISLPCQFSKSFSSDKCLNLHTAPLGNVHLKLERFALPPTSGNNSSDLSHSPPLASIWGYDCLNITAVNPGTLQ